MQDDVIYSEVMFIRREELQRKKSNTEVDEVPAADSVIFSEVNIPKIDDRQPQNKPSEAKSDSKACLYCALLAFAALCVLLLGAVISLSVLYITHGLEPQDLPSEDQTEPRLHHLQRNLSFSPSTCFQACPRDWKFYGGKCYFFSEDLLNWTLSRDSCISIGGHLAIINSREEQKFVTESLNFQMENDTDRFWIGLRDEQNDTQWTWVDNTPLDEMIRYWMGKEPGNWTKESPTGENCASMGSSGHEDSLNWYEEACATLHKRICETISPKDDDRRNLNLM
ncbi:immune-related, lectin-like receptor 4 [Salminus brasiliensis]|uniref:immune-related, lectin-like receptor 4 n=1 Tax=Salminus brasiliensis TaxID=930266 RepID=UPI003B8360A2